MSDQFKHHLQALEAAHHQALEDQAAAVADMLASRSTQQQAKAWEAVHDALCIVKLDWYIRRDMTAGQSAVATINEMADRIKELEYQLSKKSTSESIATGFMEPLSDAELALAAKPHGEDDPFAVDWLKAPEWANWHAVDRCGNGWWYLDKPVASVAAFSVGRCARRAAFLHKTFAVVGQQWKDSLRQRPGTEFVGVDSEGGSHD